MPSRLMALLCVAAVLACKDAPKQQKQDSGFSRSDKLLLVRNALPGRYVVVLEDSVPASELAATAEDLARRYKGTVLHVYGKALHGFALELTPSSAAALAEEEEVRYVEQDGSMRTAGLPAPGIALRLASGATSGPTGAGATVYVLDTGVRADHAELAGRASNVWPDASVKPEAGDCSGHGTWVAALAAGSTLGVAPAASLKAISVLGCDGSGSVSTVLAGLDWLARNHAASSVAVLPFSGAPSVSLDEALGKVIAAGVPLVAAAGNSGADACDASPGRVQSVLTLGAVADAPAGAGGAYVPLDLTNQGPCVDLFAGGDRVTSAWNVNPTSTYAMSGTSAAAARAAGAAALFLEAHPGAAPANVADGIAATAQVGDIDGLAPWTPNRVLDPSAIQPGADGAAPAVSLLELDGKVVSGSYPLASVSGTAVQVAYYVDGVLVGVAGAGSSSWLATWETALSGNGPHTVVAKAYDAAGHVGSSAPATVTVENAGFASFDPARSVLSCAMPLPECSTGPLVAGRGPVGPERNAPNTIGGACADGSAGLFHLDESIEEIRIASLDESPFAVGKGVEVRVKMWAYVDYTRDAVDLYSAPDAAKPSWRLVGTLVPSDAGENTLTLRFTLPQGEVQALRAGVRYGGSAASCTTGLYDDRDDLVFAVGPGTPDTSSPTVAVTAPGAGEAVDGETTLTAVAKDGSGIVSRVEFYVDEKLVATTWQPKAKGSSEFEASWDSRSVADGQHTIYARAVDGAGNPQPSAKVSFRVADLTPPTVALTYPPAGKAVKGTVGLEAAANDERGVVSVSFYGAPKSQLGAPPGPKRLLGTRTAPPWTLDWNTELVSDGSYLLSASAKDAAGHEATSAEVEVYVDHRPPTVTIRSLAKPPDPTPLSLRPDPPIVSGAVAITVEVFEEHALQKVEYWVGGKLVGTDTNAYSNAPTSFVWSSGTFPNGLYDIVVKASDTAGNTTASAPVRVEVRDEKPPVVAITAPARDAATRLPTTATATVEDDGIVAKVEFLLDGKVLSTDTSPPYTAEIYPYVDGLAVADGSHDLKVAAYDGAGNVTAQTVTFRVDDTAPTVSLTAPLVPATVSGTYTLEASASDGEGSGIERVEFWVGSTKVGVAHQAPYRVTWDTTRLDNATFDVGAIAYDVAGNPANSGIVAMTVENSTTAVFDATRWPAPFCAATGPFCFSATRLRSRSVIAPIAEPNQPNTLDACADGVAGAYRESESIESIEVTTRDGTPLAPGKPVDVRVEYHAFSTVLDAVDVFYAADARSPAWTYLDTIYPQSTDKMQSGAVLHVLPTGPLQAVRAVTRYAESRSPCPPGDFDDHDDLVFAVVTPGVDSTSPTVSIKTPANGGTIHGVVDVEVTAKDDVGIARVELHDGDEVRGTVTVPPYVFAFDGTDGLHSLTAVAYDTSGNSKISNPVAVTVANAANAVYDAALKVPFCKAVGAFCDSGSLLAGREGLGPEPNFPNTLRSSCPDGGWGAYLVEGSVESIVVRTFDGSTLAAGSPARVDVAVFASAAFDTEVLDLYQTTDVYAPRWQHFATLQPQQAGHQVLSTACWLPPGSRQGVRARMRYRGVEEVCGTYVDQNGIQQGVYDDHDDMAFTARVGSVAAYDNTLKVPRCTGTASFCDSGNLLDGRASLGPEANEPNTIHGKCKDGTAGTYHVDRSIDAIRVFTYGSKPLATGRTTVVETKVFASKGDRLDLHYTLDATAGNPSWAHLTTLQPAEDGLQTLSATVTLGVGSVQGVRATVRDGTGAVSTCTTGTTDDHDDLVFDVAASTPDTAKPVVRVVSPAQGTVVGTTTTLAAIATDDSGTVKQVEFLVDGTAVGTTKVKLGTIDRFELGWNPRTTGDGQHTLVARATDEAGNVSDSVKIAFWVSDVTPPYVRLTSPLAGAAVTGTVPIEATATDNRGVTAVAFFVDWDHVETATASPWRIDWNTGGLPTGWVKLVASAFDGARNSATTDPIPVFVDHIPPAVTVTAPSDGEWLSGIQTLAAKATDNDAVATVDFLLDGAPWGHFTRSPVSEPLDTRKYGDGTHVFAVTAKDRAGNETTERIAIRVDNTPPAVRLVAPVAPADIWGPYTLEADASDAGALDRVEFYAGANLVGVAYSAPYGVTWDTASYANGHHIVEAVAYDRAGNSARSTVVDMNVQNSTTASFYSPWNVLRCSETGPFCFSGTQPGGRSIEWIKVSTPDGSPLELEKKAQVQVRYSAASTADRVVLRYTTDVYPFSRRWQEIETLVPASEGVQEQSGTFSVPGYVPYGAVVVRAELRSGGQVAEYLDLAFAVARPGVDTTLPTVAITFPKNGRTVQGIVDVEVTAADDTGIARVDLYDGPNGVGWDASAPYVFVWDTAGLAGQRTLTAVAYDTAGHIRASNPVVVTVDGTAGAGLASAGAP